MSKSCDKHARVRAYIFSSAFILFSFNVLSGCGVKGEPVPYVTAYPEVVPGAALEPLAPKSSDRVPEHGGSKLAPSKPENPANPKAKARGTKGKNPR